MNNNHTITLTNDKALHILSNLSPLQGQKKLEMKTQPKNDYLWCSPHFLIVPTLGLQCKQQQYLKKLPACVPNYQILQYLT